MDADDKGGEAPEYSRGLGMKASEKENDRLRFEKSYERQSARAGCTEWSEDL